MVKRIVRAVKGLVAQHDVAQGATEAGIFDHSKRWTDGLASMTVVRLVVWVAIAAFAYQGVLSDAFKLTEWMDDHQFYSWEESDRMTLLRWGQLPAWNPYWCGGTVGAAAPEDPFFGPDFLLRIVFAIGYMNFFAAGGLLVLLLTRRDTLASFVALSGDAAVG